MSVLKSMLLGQSICCLVWLESTRIKWAILCGGERPLSVRTNIKGVGDIPWWGKCFPGVLAHLTARYLVYIEYKWL